MIKKSLLILGVLFSMAAIGFAADYTQWHLPEGATARLGKGAIKDVQFSPDGTRLAVPTAMGIWIYDAHTGKEMSLFSAMLPVQVPTALTFTADGTIVASAHGTTLRVWDIRTGDTLATLEKHPDSINALAFSPDNMILATGSGDWKIRLWDVATGDFLAMFLGSPSAVNALAFSPDGQLLASAGSTLRLWDTTTGDTRFAGTDDLGSITLLEFSPDGKTLVSGGGWDTSAHLWDVPTGKRRATLSGHTRDISDVAFSPDGKIVATAGKDDAVRVWHVNTGALLTRLPPETPSLSVPGHSQIGKMQDVYTVAFSRDGQTLRCGSRNGTIHVWDIDAAKPLSTLALTEHFEWIQTLAFPGDGARLASSGWEAKVRVWDVATGKQLEIITPPTQTHWADVSQVVTFPPTLTKLAARSLAGDIRVWYSATRQQLSTLQTETPKSIFRFVFSPDGQRIAGNERRKVILWHADTGELLWTTSGGHFAFAPDSQTLAIADTDNNIRVWALLSFALVKTLAGHSDSIHALTFSPDGRTLASGSEYEIRLWDVDTGRTLATLDTGTENVAALAFSPNGKTLVSGSSQGTLQLWNVDTASHLRSFSIGYDSAVSALLFSPDGETLASGHRSGTILLWDKLD